MHRVLAKCLKTCKSLHLGPSLLVETKAHMFPCSSVARRPQLAHMAAVSSSTYFLVQWPTVTWPCSFCKHVRLNAANQLRPLKIDRCAHYGESLLLALITSHLSHRFWMALARNTVQGYIWLCTPFQGLKPPFSAC